MSYLVSFFTALVLSMAIIPLMIRLAPRLGMLDHPDSRKVHALPIPRVGGAGIVTGTLVPLLLWAPLDTGTRAYIFGSLTLLVFGVWDDSRNLNPYLKFVGQIIAASAIVFYADIYIASLPFMDMELLPEYVAKPFTVFAIVGMINALNVSDGLDGLAGGLSILSLSCIAYMAYLAEGFGVITIVVATLGGVLGFLRYNTHPARVFMGDTGSQFLGFTLAFLAILFTQKINPAVSPSLALLFLGLPIIDILAVIVQRVHYGISPLAATKHHLHHRLLEFGFDHYEAVVMIYVIQALFVASAVPFSYESDWLIMSLYLGVSGLIYLALYVAIRRHWRAHQTHAVSWLTKTINAVKQHKLFIMIPTRFVAFSIPIFFVATSLMAVYVPRDFSLISVFLLVIMLIFILGQASSNSIVVQVINYVTAAFVVYLETKYFNVLPVSMELVDLTYFVSLAVAVGMAVRYSGQGEFRTTPTDYLMVFIVLFVGFWLHNLPEKAEIGLIAVKLIVLFYGCEFIITHAQRRWNALNLSAVVSLSVLAVRGLV
jgi:UDP-GlcNAc:undecaprenyl-phosphate GlcNAc-1-phosphate transferase